MTCELSFLGLCSLLISVYIFFFCDWQSDRFEKLFDYRNIFEIHIDVERVGGVLIHLKVLWCLFVKLSVALLMLIFCSFFSFIK